MTFLRDVQEIKTGLIIFRRNDVKHQNWYCRLKIPKKDRYKTLSLKTSNFSEARDKALEHDADLRFRVKHDVPIFDVSFSHVAEEYLKVHLSQVETSQITMVRHEYVKSAINLHLNPYIGHLQITSVTLDKWRDYPQWRKKQPLLPRGRKKIQYKKVETPPEEPKPSNASDSTIRNEMAIFRAIMRFAAEKKHILEHQVPKSRVRLGVGKRDEFTAKEYRELYTFARKWVKQFTAERRIWSRTMTYNFMLIMCNTGMRPPEARNLRWRDCDIRTDRVGRKFTCLNVRGKKMYRELVAPESVATYLDRIREISKATKPDDFVFTDFEGKPTITLYSSAIKDLLTKSGLLISSTGKSRCTYCFRHTYATFRLMEGVDVYFLAKQMGTSVLMIEKHYGHITPSKSADLILQGLPGWEGTLGGSGETPERMNADGAGTGRDPAGKSRVPSKRAKGEKKRLAGSPEKRQLSATASRTGKSRSRPR